MEIENKYKYFAFISYKREDEEWAKKLQYKLEHYKLPSNLNGKTDLPKEIRPIFRDQSDLAGGVLADEINDALVHSKYLIVICSPRAAQSEWVGKEVQAFMDMGRADKIIPFIIGGTAHAQNPQDECFPLALRELPPHQELLGVNINEIGRDAAAVKVVAQMFGLQFDELWQRHEREQRRKRLLIIMGALLLALIGVGVAVKFSQKNKWILEQNEQISKQNEDINKKNDRLQNNSVVMTAQMDSIKNRDRLIIQQQDSLEMINNNLELVNSQLITERNHLKSTNWRMQENQSRFIAEKARYLVSDGDSYLAQRLLLEVLPKDLIHLNRPYTIEAESALRKATSQNTAVFKGHTASVNTVAFSPDDKKIITTGCDCFSFVWDVSSGLGTKLNEMTGTYGDGGSCFSPDGKRILTFGFDVKVFDAQTLRLITILDVENVLKEAATFSPDGRKIFVSTFENTQVFDAKTYKPLYTLNKKTDKLTIHSFSPDGKRLCCFEQYGDSHACIIDADLGNILAPINEDDVNAMVFSPDGNIVATASHCSAKLWDSKSGSLIKEIIASKYAVEDVLFSPDGRFIATTGVDRVVRLWNVHDGQLKKEYYGHKDRALSLAFNSDGTLLASTSWDNTIRIWDIYGYQPTVSNNRIAFSNTRTFVSPNGEKTAIVSWGEPVKVVSTKTNDMLFELPENTWEVHTVDFSPDSRTFATASQDRTVRIWDANNGNELMKFDEHEGIVYTAVFSPDGKHVASGTGSRETKIRIWDIHNKKIVNTLGLLESVYSLSYSFDGHYLACITDDSTLHLFDVNSLLDIMEYEIPTFVNDDSSVKFEKESITVTTGGNQYTYDFPPLQELIDQTRERFKDRPLTPEERRMYYLE